MWDAGLKKRSFCAGWMKISFWTDKFNRVEKAVYLVIAVCLHWVPTTRIKLAE
tara:strand:+ start:430 stop:588 length:159 start_codon:yes stop_codon:yes gene_type:complete